MSKLLNWLTAQQSPDGSFREKYVFDGIFQRKIPIEFQEIALTSHVLISLSALTTQEKAEFNLTKIIDKSCNFLANRLEILDKSGTSLDIALVARALQVSNGDGAEAAFEILAKNRHEEGSVAFWGDSDICDESLSVRSTSLALMVYVDRGEFMTEPIIKWLNGKRSSSAGWGSTVDTLLATEALLKWSLKYKEDDEKIQGGVALEVNSRNGQRSIILNDLNDFITLDSSTRSINVEAKGRGLALIHLQSTYSTTSQSLIDEQQKVTACNLEPRFQVQKVNEYANQISVLSCQRYRF